jgi:hypothetical protein
MQEDNLFCMFFLYSITINYNITILLEFQGRGAFKTPQ